MSFRPRYAALRRGNISSKRWESSGRQEVDRSSNSRIRSFADGTQKRPAYNPRLLALPSASYLAKFLASKKALFKEREPAKVAPLKPAYRVEPQNSFARLLETKERELEDYYNSIC